MQTITHEHIRERDGSGVVMGFLLAVIILAILAFVFVYNGLSYFRFSSVPSGAQINVPERVNVDINSGK